MSARNTPVVSPLENVVVPPAPKKRGRKPKDPNAEPKSKKTTTKKSKKVMEKTSGQEPAEKASGEEPVEKTSGQEPVEKTSGQEPAEKASGEEPVEKTSGQEPAENASGEEPAEKTSGEKPAKSKPLSAKHAKFIHFSFFLLEHLNRQGLNIDPDLFYNAAHIFDTPDNQTSFIDNFINSSKTTSNRIKLLLKSKSKPNPKYKSKSKPYNDNDIVNHLVDLAQNNHNDNLEVSEFILNNIQYLIDNDNNIYHFKLHHCIGKLDLTTGTIIHHNNNLIH
jgi:hypothetical protein